MSGKSVCAGVVRSKNERNQRRRKQQYIQIHIEIKGIDTADRTKRERFEALFIISRAAFFAHFLPCFSGVPDGIIIAAEEQLKK